MTRCEKCGFDHENPGGELASIQVLICVCSPRLEFVTRYGKVKPMTICQARQEGKEMSGPGIQCPYCQAIFYNMDLYEEHIEMEQSDSVIEEPEK